MKLYPFTSETSTGLKYKISGVLEIPQVPFPFEFECEQPNSNSTTKQSLNYHLAVQLTFPNLMNGNLVTALSHSAIQTHTQTQTEPEAYRMHNFGNYLVLDHHENISSFSPPPSKKKLDTLTTALLPVHIHGRSQVLKVMREAMVKPTNVSNVTLSCWPCPQMTST